MSSIALQLPLVELNTRAGKIIDRSRHNQRRKELKAQSARKRSLAISYASTVPDIFFFSRDLNALIGMIKNGEEMAGFSVDEIKSLTHALTQLTERTSKMIRSFDSIGITGLPVYEYIFDRIRNGNERLESIIEGLHMSLSSEFGEMMTCAATVLFSRDSARGVGIGQS